MNHIIWQIFGDFKKLVSFFSPMKKLCMCKTRLTSLGGKE